MWEIKRYYPVGYKIVDDKNKLNSGFVFGLKSDANLACNFLLIYSLPELPNFLMARGIPYQQIKEIKKC